MSNLEEIKRSLPDNNSRAIKEGTLRDAFDLTYEDMGNIGDDFDLQSVADNGNSSTKEIVIQDTTYAASVSKRIISGSNKTFSDKAIKDATIFGTDVFSKLEGREEPIGASANSRYAAFGTALFPDLLGNTDYRPGHNVHDGFIAFGANMGMGIKDGTNVTLLGVTNFFLNDIPLWDYVTVTGKGNTNAKQKYSNPNRVAVAASDGTDLRQMLTNVAIYGVENWFGDIKDSVIIGNHTRLYKYAYMSTVLGFANMARNVSGNPSDPNEDAFLDHDLIIGMNLWKDHNKYPATHNILIGSQTGFDPAYVPIIEANTLYKYWNINAELAVKSSQCIIPDANDGSIVLFSNYPRQTQLRQRTFVAGKNVFNPAVFTHPGSTFGGFIGAGVNNLPQLGTDPNDPDHIDSITVFGQRNGLHHKKGVNIWSFGTAGHTQYCPPMKDVVNIGVFGLGGNLTEVTNPSTPTSNFHMQNIETCVNLGNNYMQFAYNSLLAGYGNNNYKIVSDSVVLGNGNFFEESTQYTKNLDHSIVIGHNIYKEADYNDSEQTHNFKVGINGKTFIKGHYGRGFNRTELFGTVILNDRLRLKSMTKAQRGTIPDPVAGDLIFQTDPGNNGPRIYDGTGWKAFQTTND